MGDLFELPRLQRRWQLCILSVILFTILALLFNTESRSQPPTEVNPVPLSHLGVSLHNQAGSSVTTKPNDVRIIGFVFFGRKDRVQILNCYLERNLAVNGGWLDEVQWIINTDTEEDLTYLHQLLEKTPSYKQVDIKEHGFIGYGLAWSMLEPGAIYVKIDDDVVFVADDTIPRIVSTKLAHPEYLVVSANMINSPLMGWLHYHMGAIHPYLPEYTNPEDVLPSKAYSKDKKLPPATRTSWRYTDYPLWKGPEDFFFSFKEDPPQIPHSWLRLDPGVGNAVKALRHTPMANSEYETW